MKKNSMSPRFFLPAFLLLLAAGLPVFSKERPNIVLFFIDDMGSVYYTHLTLPTNREV